MKPIIFNTPMVQAILSGTKTVTRRVIKPPTYVDGEKDYPHSFRIIQSGSAAGLPIEYLPYHAGEILYVRETFAFDYGNCEDEGTFSIFYKADGKESPTGKWSPAIHMPKEAARIFLRVTDVRVERLREISALSAIDEGFTDWDDFVKLWDSTIKTVDRNTYGWDANPWVWVIAFERISKDEAYAGKEAL